MFDRGVSISLSTPTTADLDEVVRALARWRREDAPMQLHPGDVGFYWQLGPEATAAALRVWRDGQRILAVGLLDGSELVRLAVDADRRTDHALARQMADDVSDPGRGVLPAGEAYVEALWDGPFREFMQTDGWEPDAPWIPMARDLSEPVAGSGLRIQIVGPEHIADRVAVHRSAFAPSKFSAERWHAMAAGTAYSDARCLVGYDDRGDAVAATTVWSAGPGKPGLLEPLGVHDDHRGHGYGTAIAVAAAAVLRDLGSSSATVCAEGSNTAAVATYRAAGYRPRGEVQDLHRNG
ncbi:acetyltransferase (GNAT) family protein [Stackebrandtia endophytica]|uniref:Acetyltransferase (GNAT) family protein n=1 Tax=Stackebrandtia endophytica TaxID=1496996 RepID=A0A543AQU8_9ACTN|nr:acetyltransferase (GNAT) family protein [Stackebrandtia endophytica]